MKSRIVLWVVILAVSTFIAAMLGCSDRTYTSTSTAVSQDASPTAYIPTEEGWRVSYVLFDAETQNFDLEVTDPVIVAGNPGFTIRRTDRTTDRTITFYRYIKDNAVFESESLSDPGVRILESPFVIGNSWNRYDTSTTAVVIDPGDGEEYDDGDDGQGGSFKTKPDGAYSTMSIIAVESVEALNGITYGGCLKVAWQTGESIINYYWYAPGIGLVKFEQNVNLLTASTDHPTGLMSDYQLVEY